MHIVFKYNLHTSVCLVGEFFSITSLGHFQICTSYAIIVRLSVLKCFHIKDFYHEKKVCTTTTIDIMNVT